MLGINTYSFLINYCMISSVAKIDLEYVFFAFLQLRRVASTMEGHTM